MSYLDTPQAKNNLDSEHKAHYPAYITLRARKESFIFYNWPHSGVAGQDPDSMAKAGFFYGKFISKYKDGAFCFQCGRGLYNWREGVIPANQHAFTQPDCPFLKMHAIEK